MTGAAPTQSAFDRMRQELEQTNSEVLRLTLELEDEIAAREVDNERLRVEMDRRREVEEVLRTQATQLEAANVELQAFCYAVSHDLRSPLRHISGFAIALQEDCADQLDTQGRQLLERVLTGCRRMDEQIDGLLVLSRLSRQDMIPMDVDLGAIVAELTETLQATAPERDAEFVVTPGVVVHGDPQLLRVVLDNLIGNAWKFTSLAPQTRIEFGRRCEDGEEVLFVRDNGVGFDDSHAARIFGAFQRLHSSEQFPGNGIGLATVQRAVRRHEGRVWATSRPGCGATFCFTLGQIAAGA